MLFEVKQRNGFLWLLVGEMHKRHCLAGSCSGKAEIEGVVFEDNRRSCSYWITRECIYIHNQSRVLLVWSW